MSTISLRLNKEEERLFKNYAEFTGEGIKTILKKTIKKKIEEEYDLQAVKEYESAKANGEVILVDHEEFWGDL